MVTGLEPLLGPAIAKAAGAGVAKLAGCGTTHVLASRRRKKIRALVPSRARSAQIEAVESLPPAVLEKLYEYCSSIEVEHIATSLSRAYLLEGAGKNADELLTSAKAEFECSIRVSLGAPVDDLVVEAIFAAVSEAVTTSVAPLLARPKLATGVEAELIATASSLATASLRNTELMLRLSDLDEIQNFADEYRGQVAALFGTMRLPHAGTTRQVPYDDLFVEPLVAVASDEGEATEKETRLSVGDLLLSTTRSVVLGDPGGGKSTLSRKLVFDVAADNLEGMPGRVPFFVELREYAATSVRGKDRSTLTEFLESLCKSPYNIEPPESAIEYLLLNDRAVVVLDGLDELLDISLRREVVTAVEGFAHRFPTCPLIVTSRRVGYAEAPLSENLFTKAGLGEFQTAQVEEYVLKWFKLDESIEESRHGQLAASFIDDSQFVQDLRVNPLMLSLMCGIYASENYIPRNRPDVYEKCALLLFERWDKQRGIIPELSFDAHVQAALRALALHIYKAELDGPAAGSRLNIGLKEGMSRRALIDFLQRYLRAKRFDNDEDAENAAVEFLDFCKGRAWVLTDVGAETYGFTHRTFLEYFAASQMVRLNTSAESLFRELRPFIRKGAADVVAQLAVQILGRTTEDGADDFLELLLEDSTGKAAGDVHAISFAGRSLNFIVPRPSVLKGICERVFEIYSHASGPKIARREYIRELFACSAENAPRIGEALRATIGSALDANDASEAALAAALLPARAGATRAYWKIWGDENLELFADQMIANSSKYYWLALLRYELGAISIRELLEMHGPTAFYRFKIAERTDTAPFVYRARSVGIRPSKPMPGLKWEIPLPRLRSIVSDITEELPQYPAPWVTFSKEVKQSALALEQRGNRGDPSVMLILLSLPLLELFSKSADVYRVARPELWQLRVARDGEPMTPDLEALLIRIRSESVAAHDLIQAWVRGNVSLLARRQAKETSKSRASVAESRKQAHQKTSH